MNMPCKLVSSDYIGELLCSPFCSFVVVSENVEMLSQLAPRLLAVTTRGKDSSKMSLWRNYEVLNVFKFASAFACMHVVSID